jgi:hypothetical protein
MYSVKDNVLSCLRAFDVLSGTISTIEAGGNGGHHDTLDDSRSQVLSLASVSDQVARFKIWAGNIGAHQKGRSSLGYRLREASHIRAQIIRLLGDLWEALQDGELFSMESPWQLFLHSLTDPSHLNLTRGADTMGQGARAAGRVCR